MVDPLSEIRKNGVYYVFHNDPDEGPSYAVVELDQGVFMYAFSTAAGARRLAEETGGVVHWHPDVGEVFAALPGELAGLILDVDLDTGEGWLLRPEDLKE
ncbi:hypothetical protein [Oceanithermus sp.]